MHDANPFNFRKDTEQDLQEQILVERLNFANDICETLEMSPEDLIGLLSELVEAVEQLDELSPKTLGSYIPKAHLSGRKATYDATNATSAIVRNRLNPNSSETSRPDEKKATKAYKVMANRERGIRRAASNLVDLVNKLNGD